MSVAAAGPALAAGGSGPPEGRAAIPDVAVSCDATLQPALRQVGALFAARAGGGPVHLFSAPPPLMLAQIERETQTDLLITLAPAIDDGARRALVKAPTRTGVGRNTLVIAARAGTAPGTDLPRLLGDGKLAVTDPTIAASFDGRAVLQKLGLADSLGARMIGGANTGEVAFLVATGAARLGLVHLTDVRADPSLVAVMPVPETAYAPILYGGAVAVTAASPNAQPFLDFLATPAARDVLLAAGLGASA